MNVLSLFSGIGGLDLGLERAGMTTVGQVEIDPFCRCVLAKHWPEVPRHDDVRTCTEWWRSTSRPRVDLVCGGFPCQPFSGAGLRRGVADERWGWPWMAAVVRALRPRFALVENVPALLRDADAFGVVLADLAALGYDTEWDCIPAAAVGAPHLRDRLFLVAADPTQRGEQDEPAGGDRSTEPLGAEPGPGSGADGRRVAARADEPGRGAGVVAAVVADPGGARRWPGRHVFRSPSALARDVRQDGPEPLGRGGWPDEPDVRRVAYGVSGGVDRRRALGNAVVPQVAEHVGRLIVAAAA